MTDLLFEKCVPCSKAVDPLSLEEIQELLCELDGWSCSMTQLNTSGPGRHAYLYQLVKVFEFKTFKAGLEFVKKLGYIAEQVNHHPNISIS